LKNVIEKSNAALYVLMGGDGVLRSFIEGFIEKNGLGGRVRLLGALDRDGVRQVLQISDLHVYAGVMGCSFSIALLEAMACGNASIVTPVPAAHREVVTAERGWIVPPRDVAALERALRQALGNRARLAEMGDSARRYIVENHSFDVAGRYFEI